MKYSSRKSSSESPCSVMFDNPLLRTSSLKQCAADNSQLSDIMVAVHFWTFTRKASDKYVSFVSCEEQSISYKLILNKTSSLYSNILLFKSIHTPFTYHSDNLVILLVDNVMRMQNSWTYSYLHYHFTILSHHEINKTTPCH